MEVDYYTYGMCRLAAGKYYCGSLAAVSPYKGLANTKDTPHIATDPYTRHDPATGSTKADAPGYAKVRKAANPAYYRHRPEGGATDLMTNPENNGMYLAHASSTSGKPLGTNDGAAPTTALYNQYTNDRKDDSAQNRYSIGSAASNYGMTPTTAKYYNTGPHVVGGSKPGTNYAMEPEAIY